MQYEDVIRDFARRTQSNLEAINRLKDSGHDVYEATQLINSMLGLLVFPKEEYFNRIPTVPLSELEAKGWPVPRVTGDFAQVTDLRHLIRCLRNAIAHFNIEFPGDGTNELRQLRVWNTRKQGKQKTWQAELTLDELADITNRFIQLLLADEQPEAPTSGKLNR